jgi:hypothetical protein
MFDPVILLNGRRIGQMNPVAGLHPLIDKPVPIVSRFHYESRDLGAIGRPLIENDGELMGYPFVMNHSVLLIE